MTTMLSLILAFMLSIGGSPAASVNLAGCPGDTGIHAPIDNNCTINHFSEYYNQKTASSANSKKTGKIPSINDLETSSSIMFTRFSIEKLRQARYFDHKSYRFNSVDPIITKVEALSNPQLWNLYAYCRNNPITYFDPDGKVEGSAARRILVYNQLYIKWLNEGGREYADQKLEMIYQSEFVAGLAGAAGAAVLAAPEVIAATGPPIKKVGDKIANFFSRFSQGNSSINYNKLFEALSKNSLRHIIKHLSEFQKYDQNMTLRKLVDLGHKIASNANNLVGTPGGRKVFEATVEIGGKSLNVRAVLNTAGKLTSVHIR